MLGGHLSDHPMRPLVCLLPALAAASSSSAQHRPTAGQALAVGLAATAGMAAGAVGGVVLGDRYCRTLDRDCKGLIPEPAALGFVGAPRMAGYVWRF